MSELDFTVEKLGADRIISPAGVLPQSALVLDPSGPVRDREIEIEVEVLCLDATSFRQLTDTFASDKGVAREIQRIIAERGKMHNPHTDSGGILLGRVSGVGPAYPDPPSLGEQIVTLSSLALTPLRVEKVCDIDRASGQVQVVGTAYLPERAAWAPMVDDIPLDLALSIYDVCGAASHTRSRVPETGTVCVLGAGRAGMMTLAAARDSMKDGTLVALDVNHDALARLKDAGLCDITVEVDLRRPLDVLEAAREHNVPQADFTVAVTNASGCETSALLLTARNGTIYFFSMGTNFATVALTADGITSMADVLVGVGYAPDKGSYAMDLVRRSQPLRAALGLA